MCIFHGKRNERVYPDLYALSSRFGSRFKRQGYFGFIVVLLSSTKQMAAQHFRLIHGLTFQHRISELSTNHSPFRSPVVPDTSSILNKQQINKYRK